MNARVSMPPPAYGHLAAMAETVIAATRKRGRRRRELYALAGILLTIPAMAQGDDAAYCAKLADLALRYTGGAGGEGRLTPDLSTRAAIDDCNKGNTAAGIPVLEKLLRSQGFTLPKR